MKSIKFYYILLLVLFFEKVYIVAGGVKYKNIVSNKLLLTLMDLTVNPIVYTLIALTLSIYLAVKINNESSTHAKTKYGHWLTYTLTTLVMYFLIVLLVPFFHSFMK